VVNIDNDTGEDINITMRSLGMKEVTNWESDAPYDYWSQTKVNTNPSDLDRGGAYDRLVAQEANGLTTYDLNVKGSVRS